MLDHSTQFPPMQEEDLSEEDTKALAQQANRSMKVQVNIQDGEVMVNVGESILYVTPVKWKEAV